MNWSKSVLVQSYRGVYIALVFVLAVIVALIGAMQITHAASGNSLYISSATLALAPGATTTVTVRAYAAPINSWVMGTASGSLSYPTNLVQVTAISTNGSAYGVPSVSNNATTGKITFSGSRFPAPSGDIKLFTVTIRAKTAGVATLNFGSESKVNTMTTTTTPATYMFMPKAPFNRGVNLTGWFQSASAHDIPFTVYTKQDFQNIKSLGVDTIRLPINLHAMTSGAPNYTIDPLLLNLLDQAVGWAQQLNMHLILDDHSAGTGPGGSTDPSVEAVLTSVWTQLAAHYSGSYQNLYYEILNEPNGIDSATWGAIQGRVIAAIRAKDQAHSIIVGGINWDNDAALTQLPVYTDPKLIYTFHFYDPMLFTHQGTNWTSPSLADVQGIPFPYNAASMPPLSAEYQGTWVQDNYNAYPHDGTVQAIRDGIKVAANFSAQRNVPVYAGEFGVYNQYANNTDRVAWYQAARQAFDDNLIAWTTWDYNNQFGLFTKGSNELFGHDLNTSLLTALGLTVPPQTPYQKQPDTTGFTIYDDYVAQGLRNMSYTSGSIDTYASAAPQSGSYDIKWANPGQYEAVSLDFRPDHDLTTLKSNGYVLDFYVKTSASQASFNARFINPDVSNTDTGRPWREISTTTVNGGGASGWQHIQIPLSAFVEQGAYQNGQWYNPIGKFDWSTIDKIEFVTEQSAYPQDTIEFDQITIKQP